MYITHVRSAPKTCPSYVRDLFDLFIFVCPKSALDNEISLHKNLFGRYFRIIMSEISDEVNIDGNFSPKTHAEKT